MTDKELRMYQTYKRKAEDLKRRITNLRSRGITTCEKVKSSMAEFPYIEVMATVQGTDDFAIAQYREERRELLRSWKKELARAMRHMAKIEKFIQCLPEENDIQNIFRWTYFDGMKQLDIAKKLNVDHSTISKRMSKYID